VLTSETEYETIVSYMCIENDRPMWYSYFYNGRILGIPTVECSHMDIGPVLFSVQGKARFCPESSTNKIFGKNYKKDAF